MGKKEKILNMLLINILGFFTIFELFKDHTNVYYYLEEHLHYFINAKCLWIDATFRVCGGLRSKWRQCLVISARVEIDGSTRYLPVFAILMKTKRKSNYRKVFSHLKQTVLKDMGRPKGKV